MFLIISLIWFIISVIISITYNTNPIWLVIFFLMTIIYIPIAIHLAHEGDIRRVETAVNFTIIATLIYLVIELILAMVFLINVAN